MRSEWYAIIAIELVGVLIFVISFLGYRQRIKWDREYDEKHKDDGWAL